MGQGQGGYGASTGAGWGDSTNGVGQGNQGELGGGQMNMPDAHQNYTDRTNWAQDQLNWLQGILSGAPAQQQQFNQSPAPSPVSQLLGLGLVGSQIGNLFGGEGP